MVKKINPKELYPLVKLETISPDDLGDTIKKYKEGQMDDLIEAIEYEGFYYIYEGNCEAIAACINNIQDVAIELLDRSKIPFWNDDKNLEDQLASIGMNAVYDFEAMAGFKYSEYPRWYKE